MKPSAREWLNKKHFTSDSGVTLDCLAKLPDEHVIGINLGQLAVLLDAFAESQLASIRERLSDREGLARVIGQAHLDYLRTADDGPFYDSNQQYKFVAHAVRKHILGEQ